MVPAVASAAPLWFDNGTFIDPNINDLSHHVELEDLDGDGDVDIIFVNNTDENTGNPGSAQLNRVYLNDGGIFTDDGGNTFQIPDNARVVKTGDVNGDGNVDIVAGACWSGDSYILFGSGGGTFIEGGSLPTGITVGEGTVIPADLRVWAAGVKAADALSGQSKVRPPTPMSRTSPSRS